jgi:hypothetical protein
MVWAAICRARGCGWEAVTGSEEDARRCLWVHERHQPGHRVSVVFRGLDLGPDAEMAYGSRRGTLECEHQRSRPKQQ